MNIEKERGFTPNYKKIIGGIALYATALGISFLAWKIEDKNGKTHIINYNPYTNKRVTWDIDEQGTVSGVHTVDQTTKKITQGGEIDDPNKTNS